MVDDLRPPLFSIACSSLTTLWRSCQCVRLIQQGLRLCNKLLSLGTAEGLAIKLSTIQYSDDLSGQGIPLTGQTIDLAFNGSVGRIARSV